MIENENQDKEELMEDEKLVEEARMDSDSLTSGLVETLEKVAWLEGVIFASASPVPISILVDLFDLERSEVEALLDALIAKYETREHGMHLVKVANGYQFRTKFELKPIMARFYEKKPPRLTQPTLEVLSVIAYKQPITRPEIEKIRGVDCTGVIKTLLERELIEMQGRADLPGQPTVYGTTPKFLEWFQIGSLADLPPLSEMEALNRNRSEAAEGEELLQLLSRDEGFTQEILEDVDSTLQSVKVASNVEIQPEAHAPEARP